MKEATKKAIEGGWGRNQWVAYGFFSVIGITSKGKTYSVLVDNGDLDALSRHRWYLTQNGYAISSINGKRLRMTHFLLGKPPKGKVVDHINRNRLDNRRHNLRFVSIAQNGFNTTAKGVRQRGNSWEANVCVNYRKHFKGGFKSKEQALEWRESIKSQYAKTIWI